MNLAAVLRAWGRAFASQFRFKIVLLSMIPLLISLAVWGGLMAWRLQALFDFIHAYFADHNGFANASAVLNSLGLLALKTVIVPLLAMWLLLPLVIITSLLFIGVFAMPSISKHIGLRDFPQLARLQGSSFFASLGFSLGSFFLFVFVWVLTLPLAFVPPVYVVVQPILWGWLTYRVMSYDALALFATKEERQLLVAQHRPSLLLIGVIAGWFSGLPSILWMGAMSVAYVAFFPVFVSLAIWVYLLIFIFTGLWYQYYCLDALQKMRQVSDQEAEVI